VDRGFVMSDHADWQGLQQAIKGTGAERVFVTHGSVAIMVRWLTENGLDAQGFKTEYGDEDMADKPEAALSAAESIGDLEQPAESGVLPPALSTHAP
jgi:putative mRNA 3-end processing factor